MGMGRHPSVHAPKPPKSENNRHLEKTPLDEFQRIRDSVRQRPDGRANGNVILSEAKDLGPDHEIPRLASSPQDDRPTWDTLKRLNQSLLTFPDLLCVQ